MGTAKIQVTVGRVTFSGEGSEAWLTKQLDKVLETTKRTALEYPPEDEEEDDAPNDDGDAAEDNSGANGNGKRGGLATYLRKNAATDNQTRKFLATAAWLGKPRWKRRDITKALKDAHQKRLSNPGSFLSSAARQGYVGKDGSSYYLTPEGHAFLKNGGNKNKGQ